MEPPQEPDNTQLHSNPTAGFSLDYSQFSPSASFQRLSRCTITGVEYMAMVFNFWHLAPLAAVGSAARLELHFHPRPANHRGSAAFHLLHGQVRVGLRGASAHTSAQDVRQVRAGVQEQAIFFQLGERLRRLCRLRSTQSPCRFSCSPPLPAEKCSSPSAPFPQPRRTRPIPPPLSAPESRP